MRKSLLLIPAALAAAYLHFETPVVHGAPPATITCEEAGGRTRALVNGSVIVDHPTQVCFQNGVFVAQCVGNVAVTNIIVCGGGKTCINGACACPGSMSDCGTYCADLQIDPMNCGACGNVCSPFQCAAGSCP